MPGDGTPTYTIIQADGLFSDDEVENEIFAPRSGQEYEIDYQQVNLWRTQAEDPKPWSSIPEELRKRVNGITNLKLYFTAEDVELFPNLKV